MGLYGEAAYGFAKTGQTIVNATDGKIIRLYVDDEPLEIHKMRLREFRRTPDWRTGTVDREILWETPAGKRVAISSRRMVSMTHRHLAVLTYDVRCLNHAAHVILSSEMMVRQLDGGGAQDPRKLAGFDGRVLEPVAQRSRERRVVLAIALGAAESRWPAGWTISSSPGDAVGNPSAAATTGLRWFFPSRSTRSSPST
jgi:alpha,alpha-trehalose phosphorylase